MKRITICLIACIQCFVFLKCSHPNFSDENSIIINNDSLEFEYIPLSDILTIDEIIPLETNPQCLISYISKVIFFNNQFFIIDVSSMSILSFSSTGKFIRRYGSVGKGPGEFLSPMSIDINKEDNTLLIFDSRTKDILVYSIDGAFIKSIQIDDGLICDDIAVKDNIIYLNTVPFTKEQYEESYNIRMFNMDGKYLGGLLKVSENNMGWIGDNGNIYCFTEFGDSLRYYNSISNHIYALDKKNVDVLYTVNSKQFLTEKDIRSVLSNKEGLYVHEKINMLLESGKKTTIDRYLENDKYAIMYQFYTDLIVYNKQTKKARYGFITDDILNTNNSHEFFRIITDEYCFGFVNPINIDNYNNNVEDKKVSLPKEKLDILSTVESNSNPVIVKFKFK